MNMVEILEKKKLGRALNREELAFVAEQAAHNDNIDYQLAALLMAIRIRGMTIEETTNLTLEMAKSGDIVDLTSLEKITIDKHSTGGVADTTTLILVPLVAACGGYVAKMSGRGLGHTGGTIDKLESIPGMGVEISEEQFVRQVRSIGCAIISQNQNIAPADKKLYALRDVTATVDSLPLIASSIMSKKIASGSDGIVLDVKTGSGAMMSHIDDSVELAKIMVDIGRLSKRRTMAIITDMDEPLGSHIGNALEVKEAIEVLQGKQEGPLLEVSLCLGSYMLVVAGITDDKKEAYQMLKTALREGKGLDKLKDMIRWQGGDDRICDNTDLLPKAPYIKTVLASKDGYIQTIDTRKIGIITQGLGAGRSKKEDIIDPSVGLVIHRRIGDKVLEKEPLFTIHSKNKEEANKAIEQIEKSIIIGDAKLKLKPLIAAVVKEDSSVIYL